MFRKKFTLNCFLFISISLVPMSLWGWCSGFYLGGGLGTETSDFDQNATIVVQPSGILDANVKDTTHFSGTGIFGTLFGGYGFTWYNNLYLAGEINTNFGSDEFKSENLEFVHANFVHTKYRMPNSFGASLLPGYVYRDVTLIYGRLGYANGNFKISSQETTLANINRRLNGFRFGWGFSEAFTQRFITRLEYSKIFYQATRFTVADSAATQTTKITPTTGMVEFGLIYNFV